MKTKKKWTIIAGASLIMIFAVTFAVQAKPFGRGKHGDFGHRGMGMESGMGRLGHLVDLTDDQEAQIKEIRTAHLDRVKDLRDSLRSSRDSMKALREAEKFNEESVRSSFREGSQVREDLFVLKAKMMFEIKAVLTPEQVALLEEKRAQRRERMKHHLEERIDRLEE